MRSESTPRGLELPCCLGLPLGLQFCFALGFLRPQGHPPPKIFGVLELLGSRCLLPSPFRLLFRLVHMTLQGERSGYEQ